VTVRVEFINPFVTAAADVLRAEVGLEVSRGGLTLAQSAATAGDVTTLINLIGDVEGVVLYSMPLEMCLALVSQMIGQDFEEFDELAQSGIAELGNVITGKAAAGLSQAGYEASISVPTLVIGRGATISTLDFRRLVVPLQTNYGVLEIHVALREHQDGHGQ